MYASHRDAAMSLFMPGGWTLERKLRVRAMWTVCHCVGTIEEAQAFAEMLGLIDKGKEFASVLVVDE